MTLRSSLCAAVLVGLGGLSRVCAEDIPAVIIPHDEHARTAHQLMPLETAWNHRTMTALLEQAPDAPGKAQALAALRLVESALARDPQVTIAQVMAAIDAAQAAGSRDAMVAYYHARFASVAPDELVRRYQIAHALFPGSPYPAIRKAFCSLHIQECLQAMQRNGGDSSQLEAARAIAETDLMDGLAGVDDQEVGIIGPSYPLMAELFESQAYLSQPGAEDRILKELASKRIPPWWSGTLQGITHITLAWIARGSGWADTITEAGGRRFDEHLRLASDCLTAAWKLHPDRPQPACEMITVAMGGQDAEGDAHDWFERAVTAQMDDLSAYQALRLAWRPRWGGSHEHMLAIGLGAAQTKRYDTEVPWQLFVSVCDVYQDTLELSQPRPEALTPQIYQRCVEVVDQYRTLHPQLAAYYATCLAAAAWACGQRQEVITQLDAAGDHVDHARLRSLIHLDASELRKQAMTPAPDAPADHGQAAPPREPEPEPLIP